MTEGKKSSVIVILLAWMVVAIPAGWGVYNTALNSMKLFRGKLAVAAVARTATIQK